MHFFSENKCTVNTLLRASLSWWTQESTYRGLICDIMIIFTYPSLFLSLQYYPVNMMRAPLPWESSSLLARCPYSCPRMVIVARALSIFTCTFHCSTSSSLQHYHHWHSVLARLVGHPYHLCIVPFHVRDSFPVIESSTHHHHHWCHIARRILCNHYHLRVVFSLFLILFFNPLGLSVELCSSYEYSSIFHCWIKIFRSKLFRQKFGFGLRLFGRYVDEVNVLAFYFAKDVVCLTSVCFSLPNCFAFPPVAHSIVPELSW